MPKKKRRRKGSGAPFRREQGPRKGQWLARKTVRTISGDSRRVTFAGRTREEVEAKIREAQDKGRFRAGAWSTRVLADFAKEWLVSARFKQYRPTTRACYEQDIRDRVIPELGTIRLGDLRASDIAAWIVDMKAASVGKSVAARAVRSLSSMLSTAVESGLIEVNPIRNLTHRQHVGYQAKEPKTLDFAQLIKLFRELSRYRFGAMVLLAATSGMRLGEMLGLRWEDIDFEEKRLEVHREIVQVGKTFHTMEPKTPSSKRRFGLTEETLEELRAHRKRMQKENRAGERDFIFVTIHGTTPQRGNLLTKVLHAALKHAKLPKVSIRELRPSYTSVSRELGVPVEAVSRTLGHKHVTTTLRFYSKAFRSGQDRTAADAWETALSGGDKVPRKVPKAKPRQEHRKQSKQKPL